MLTAPHPPATALLGRLTGNGVAGAVALPNGHNRAELLADADVGVTGGTWAVERAAVAQGVRVSAPAAALAATGARAVLEVAPGAMLTAALSGYAGAGEARIVVASWREA